MAIKPAMINATSSKKISAYCANKSDIRIHKCKLLMSDFHKLGQCSNIFTKVT